jgi:uncharacterized protein YegP (UPF0339 family)
MHFQWMHLLRRLERVQLTDGSDEFHWNLKANQKITVESMYRALVDTNIPVDKIHKNMENECAIKS